MMKKMIAMVLSAVMLCAMHAATGEERLQTDGTVEASPAPISESAGLAADVPLVGGWENVPHGDAELPEDAQTAFDKALDGLVGAKYTPVALLSTQVVAGMNYCILCQITPVSDYGHDERRRQYEPGEQHDQQEALSGLPDQLEDIEQPSCGAAHHFLQVAGYVLQVFRLLRLHLVFHTAGESGWGHSSIPSFPPARRSVVSERESAVLLPSERALFFFPLL